MKRIQPERVRHALHNVHNWALSCRTQGAAHIIPLLALLGKRAGVDDEVIFEEKDDFEFWDTYFRVLDEGAKPYFNPVTMKLAEEGFPHSNAATIRKNTFRLKWGAGKTEQGEHGTEWSLSPDYAEIIREKVLTKGGGVIRAPALDFAVLLLRDQEFEDDADAATIIARFRSRFPMRDEDFDTLFTFHGESPEAIYTNAELDVPAVYNQVILEELVPEQVVAPTPQATPAQPTAIDEDDPIFIQVQQLLTLKTSGIIFRGPPGTGKTRYAQKVAARLVADPTADVFRVQFHPSYGYEDFVEGYKPDDTKRSGFDVVPKNFLRACDRASSSNGYVVVIIDEINRGDPARIFGELLTYLEDSYREQEFFLPFSGEPVRIPRNLLIFGTMNPYDRSVAQVDAAFVRRFDHIDVEPSSEAAQSILEKVSDFTVEQINQIVRWFENAQRLLEVGLGHSFFKDVTDLDRLKLVWKYRIKPTAETLLEFTPANRDNFFRSFDALLARLEAGEPEE